jgi:hypothetical protein
MRALMGRWRLDRTASLSCGREGISSNSRDDRGRIRREAIRTPPALTSKVTENSRKFAPLVSVPLKKTGIASGIRCQRRRSPQITHLHFPGVKSFLAQFRGQDLARAGISCARKRLHLISLTAESTKYGGASKIVLEQLYLFSHKCNYFTQMSEDKVGT